MCAVWCVKLTSVNIGTHHGIIYIHMEELGSLAITAVQVEDLVAMGFDGEIAREAVEDLHYGLE